MKKFLFLFILSFFILSACGKNNKQASVSMDALAEDNLYHYANQNLAFSLDLPKEFIYYQTQREESKDFIDIEFFVPTADKNYFQKVPGYAEAIVVRVFLNEKWDEILEQNEDKTEYKILGRKNKKVYTIKFWDTVPRDWSMKWNNEMKEQIEKSFKLK